MIKALITDPSSKIQASVVDGDEEKALVVATRPLKTFQPFTAYFTNDTYGREMAQDAAFGAGELLIHNGVDDVAWTMSNEVGGKWREGSTERPYAGTKSLRCDKPAVNDIMQVINNVGPGDDIDMTLTYIALTMWINVDKDWKAGDSFSIYAMVGGAQVGNKVYLEDYFAFDSYDIYQFINIPLTDMGLSTATLDAFRIENEAAEGKSPKFYVDNMYLQTTGAPIIYTVEPDRGTWLHVTSFMTTFVDALDNTLADASVPNFSYEQILGMTPVAGFIYKRYAEGKAKPIDEQRITSLMDLLSLPYTRIASAVSDKTNTMINVATEFPTEIINVLKSESLDKMTFTIEDAFDGLLFFRISLTGFMEYR